MDRLPDGYLGGSCTQTPDEYIEAHVNYRVQRDTLIQVRDYLLKSLPGRSDEVYDWCEVEEKIHALENDVANHSRQLTRQPDIRNRTSFMQLVNATITDLQSRLAARPAFREQHAEWTQMLDGHRTLLRGSTIEQAIIQDATNKARMILQNDKTVKANREKQLSQQGGG